MTNFVFNRTRKPYISILKGRILPTLAPFERNFLDVPRRPGSIYTFTKTNARPLEIPVWIAKPRSFSFPKLREELAAWLLTDQPQLLTFDDDPDRHYVAMLESIDNFEIVNNQVCTTVLRFVCPEPYKFSDERRIRYVRGFTHVSKAIDNLGSVKTFPLFDVDVKEPLTYFALRNQTSSSTDYIQIGTAKEQFVHKEYEPETLILRDDMATTAGWSLMDFVDNGYVAGEIEATGSAFTPKLVGHVIQPPQWQGPALKRNIGQALQDFRSRVYVELWNTPEKRTGMIEIYFMNAQNETVCKLGVQDRHADRNHVTVKAQLGGLGNRVTLYGSPGGLYGADDAGAKDPRWWDNFSGCMEIIREGRDFYCYFSTIDSKGVHTYPRGTNRILHFRDNKSDFQSPITQVGVSFRISPETEKAVMKVTQIDVHRLNKHKNHKNFRLLRNLEIGCSSITPIIEF